MSTLPHVEGEDEAVPEPELEPWVKIQQNTFTNWINDKLRAKDEEVDNIRTDFKSGIKLCKLMDSLKGKKIGRIIQKKQLREYEARGNIALALQAMKSDDIKLVNIGPEDVYEGNTKIILGMIWSLIRRYQIGSQTKLPPKKLMLDWVNAILHPYVEVNNFSSDWNDGIALSGVVEFCRPGTFPNWYSLSRSDGFSNCQSAMLAAEEYFGISLVVSPENFSSPHLDDLSGMTYLSYFMEPGSCGFVTTLKWLKQTLAAQPDGPKVDNFDTDWNNGYMASALAVSLGGDVPGWPNISGDWESNCQTAMTVSEEQLGVPHVLNAKDMINPEVDHIALMAYTAWHIHSQSKEPAPPKRSSVILTPEPLSLPPDPTPDLAANVAVNIVNTWRLGATTTFTVDSTNEGEGEVTATAHSPSGRESELSVSQTDACLNDITFQPDEQGVWQILIMYQGSPVQGSPYEVVVYDPSLARIIGNSSSGETMVTYNFEVECRRVGISDVDVHVLYDGEHVPCTVSPNGIDSHQVRFTPDRTGLYQVHVYCGGVELPDSPFDVTISEGVPAEEPRDVSASGPGLSTGMIGKETSIYIDTTSKPSRPLDVTIRAPNGQEVNYYIRNQTGDGMEVVYTPQDIGNHTISLTYDDVEIDGSPFNVYMGEGQIYIRNLQNVAYAGQESDFEIDCSEMPKGTVEIDSDLPIHRYVRVRHQTYSVTFLPKRVGKHDLIIKYNENPVGEPYVVDVIAPSW